MNDWKERLSERLEKAAAEHGLEVVSLTVHGTDIRIALDREGGIRLEECARVNKHLCRFIDEESLISGPYTIEVSSPGLDRELATEKDFSRVSGKKIKLWLRESQDEKLEITGKVTGVRDGGIVLEYGAGKNNRVEQIFVRLDNINKAKLEIGW